MIFGDVEGAITPLASTLGSNLFASPISLLIFSLKAFIKACDSRISMKSARAATDADFDALN